jgi:ribosome-associated protein
MDYVDFIVHVFSAEKRAFYGLERLRKSATRLSIDDVHAELKAQIAGSRKKSAEAATKPKKVVAAKKTGKKAVAKKAVPAKKAHIKIAAKNAAKTTKAKRVEKG